MFRKTMCFLTGAVSGAAACLAAAAMLPPRSYEMDLSDLDFTSGIQG